MTTRRLIEGLQPLVHSLRPTDRVQHDRATRAVVNEDNTVNPDSFIDALPWQVRDAVFPGEVAIGANLRRFAMPQGARIRHVAISAGTPPSGGSFVINVTAGSRTESMSLPSGKSTELLGVNIPVDPGVFAGVSVMAVNGAEDVIVTIHYTAGEA